MVPLHSIRRIFESGLHAYHLKIWQQRKPECPQSAVVVSPIDLEHFAAALWLLAGGIGASVAVLVGEMAMEWRLKRRVGRKAAAVTTAGIWCGWRRDLWATSWARNRGIGDWMRRAE